MIDKMTKISLLHIQKSSVQTKKIGAFFEKNECECPFNLDFDYNRVPNPKDALKHIERFEVDVILLKVRETSYSQLDQIQALRQALPYKPIILLCDAMRDTSAKKALESGADDCLHSRGLDRELLLRSILLWHRIRKTESAFLKSCFMTNIDQMFSSVDGEEDAFLESLGKNLKDIEGANWISIFELSEDRNRIRKRFGTSKTCPSEICDNIPAYGTPFWEDFRSKLRHEQTFDLYHKESSKNLEKSEIELFFPLKDVKTTVIPVKDYLNVYGFILIGKRVDDELKETEIVFIKVATKLASMIFQRKAHDRMFSELTDTLRLLNKILRHDIMNNLSVIYGVLNLYSTSKDESLIQDTREAIDRSITFIERMKDYEGSLKLGVELRAEELRPIVEKTFDIYPVDHTIRGNCTALIDDAMTSVINNIVGNALEHSNGSRIDVVMTQKDTEAIIEISDNGEGIPDRFKNMIFDEGFAKGRNPGTGLGLFIVKKIITRYRGTISVLDNNPQGTTFRIHLQSPVG